MKLEAVNEVWKAFRNERGHFEVKKLAQSWGWIFKADEPLLDNSVGFQDGFKSAEEAEEGVVKFVKKVVMK